MVRDADWIRRHVGPDAHVEVTDVSGAYAVLGLMGPRSRELLQRVSRADLTHEGFPFATSRLVDVGPFTVRATRITYVGELGWELYVPAEFAPAVYDLLHEHGADLGLRNAGYYALNALRLEKGYRAFGAELTPDHSPVEAGLVFACKLGTDIPFLGREAVEAARAAGPRRRLVSVVLNDAEPMLWGGELVLRDGVAVGQVTSAALATTTGTGVALAYVWRPDGEPVDREFVEAGDYAVNVGGAVVSASVGLRAPYDPTGERIKS